MTAAQLTLYPQRGAPPPAVMPSPRRRAWLAANTAAPHCLPLMLANQLGWAVGAPHAIAAVWDGGEAPEAVTVTGGPYAAGHFGSGIVTVSLPFLVRTPPGVATWVKAVPNLPKHGVCVLEALVDTAPGADFTFTLNVRLTEPGASVVWAAGEPLAQLVPWPAGWLDHAGCEVVTAGACYEAEWAAADRWSAERATALATWPGPRDGAYRNGRRHDGQPGPGPRPTKLVLVGPQPGPPEF
jgi:hypothetical protein